MTVAGLCSPVGGSLLGGTAPLTFTPASPGAQVASDVQVLWDFDNDGDWDQAVEDITAYVMAAETGTGRDHPSNLTGKAGPGKLRLSLNNTDGRFSYFNTSSPLNADPFSLKTGRRVRVQTTDGNRGASLITYVGIGAVSAGSNAPVTPALPAGLAVGDLMVCLASIRNSGSGLAVTPTGWGVLVTSGNVTVLGRYYQTGDTAPTITFTGGVANATTLAQVAAFRGCHQTLSHVIESSATQLNGSAQNIAVPARTVAEDNCALVVCGWKQDDWTSVATLAGQTEIADSPSALGDDAGHVIDYVIQTTATNLGATSFTVTGGASAISRALVFTLRPAIDLADPVLLVRDRFDRPNFLNLGVAETGQAWTVRSTGGFAVLNGTASANDDRTAFSPGTDIVETIDTGATDHYVQASIPHLVQAGKVGVICRYVDTANYTRAFYSTADHGIIVEDIAASVVTTFTTFNIEGWEGMTLGLGVVNQTVTVYVGGFALASYDLSRAVSGTAAGLYGFWQTWSDLPPAFDDFHVYDRVATDLDGVLFTGKVKTVSTAVKAGDLHVVTVDCEGPLADAALAEVAAPRVVRSVGEHVSGTNSSVPAGALVGDIMARGMLLHPPHPVDGADTGHIGPVALPDDKALSLARTVETSEMGFLKETQQGQIAFEDRTFRSGDAPQAWFTDTPGTGQYGYSELTPLDQNAEIVNRSTARVAATCPTVVSTTIPNGGDPSAMVAQVLMPGVEAGQLILVFIVGSADATNVEWGCQPPWKAERNLRQQEGNGIRVFSLVAQGGETGTNAYFYKGTSGGTFTSHVYVIDDWFGSEDGIKVGRASTGLDPYPVTPGWDRAPALFIVCQAIIGLSSGTGAGLGTKPAPVGYSYSTISEFIHLDATPAFTTGVASVFKTDVTDTENPGPWEEIFTDYLIIETICVAVRGYDGPTVKNTTDDAKAITQGGTGVFVTRNDPDSQVDHNLIRTNPDIPQLLYTAADAEDWDDAVLAEHADDRPIITMSFWASKNSQLREQAMRRRVSDRITVTATGNAGLGISGDFHIEHVAHRFTNGGRLWECRWELSPATD